MVWTQFMDMHSGGGTKQYPYSYIYIEAPQHEAETVFYNRFGHDPNRITCSCCGEDYSITQSSSLVEATAYERGCAFDNEGYIEQARVTSYYTFPYQTLEQYLENEDILIIYASEIEDHERRGEIPQSGWVWHD